ncbi:MAG: hypothetical protein M3541_20930 [Acidobacteriota bacterium]|nr:hypothetical protein [Acidobacteriota bacterium]
MALTKNAQIALGGGFLLVIGLAFVFLKFGGGGGPYRTTVTCWMTRKVGA